jgi:hypothetical protein
MEGLLAWVKEHVSPTALLEETGADDGYRKDDGSWFEPLPSSLHYHQQCCSHSSVVGDLFNCDLHNLHSVNERLEFAGQVFWVSKAIIFNAKDHEIEDGTFNSWATSQEVDLKVLPKDFSKHPSRTFCIVQPRKVCNFFSTFRAWLILNGYDMMTNRSLIDNDYFRDILVCHDDFFANLGTRENDLQHLLEFYDPYVGDLEYDPSGRLRRELKRLWAKYLWARVRKKMIHWSKYGSVFISICSEVQARPGNSTWKSAKRSFESIAA